MILRLHKEVYSDIDAIMSYYEEESGTELADAFYDELRLKMQLATSHQERYTVVTKDLRPTNLSRFPYHFLFRQVQGGIRILVVRHHRRCPDTGMGRH